MGYAFGMRHGEFKGVRKGVRENILLKKRRVMGSQEGAIKSFWGKSEE